jgi:hypothetical protein
VPELRSTDLPAIVRLIGAGSGKEELGFGPDQWDDVALAARQQRLRPWLHLRRLQCGWQVPADLSEECAQAYRRSAMRVLRQKAELARMTRWLAEAGIAAHVLKGGAIVWRGWFDPALRPMRDLDLLVSPEHANRAQELLFSKGFTGQRAAKSGNNKHLPGLVAPTTGVVVEIHTRLIDVFTPEWDQRDQLLCKLAISRAWQMPTSEGGYPIFADEDTLLHLIMHAVLDHQFNNGPLLLIDIEALVVSGHVDWPCFWNTAQAIGAVRAAQLALRLAETVWPTLPIDWQGHEPSALDARSVASAASLMLVPIGQQTELGFVGRLARFRWTEQSAILFDSILRKSSSAKSTRPGESNSPLDGPVVSLSRRIANAGSRKGRDHIKRSLEVARWLRQ